MKPGPSTRVWGRHSTFTLAALVFTTLFFWYWENNPLLTSLLSAQEQFMMRTPDLFMDYSTDNTPLLNPRKQMPEEEDSVSQVAEDKEEDNIVKHAESDLDTMSTEDKDEDGGSASSSENMSTEDKDEDGGSASSSENMSTEEKDDDGDSSSSSEKQACNYGKGRWVADSRRPLYSGFGCKQWLSDMWACRLTQRTDFSYEGYRWQPSDCEMPEFQVGDFLTRMQDKTIAFIGDSLGRQQFQSLMCMVSGGHENLLVENMENKYGLVKLRGSIRPDGWAFRFPDTNTTILYYWSASLCDIEPINATDPATEFAMHLDRPPAFLKQFLPEFDVVVLNTGHHWNRGKLRSNRWVMYANGEPVIDRKLAEMGNAKNYTLHSITRWLDSQLLFHPKLKVFLQSISPRHFADGDWNTGGSCDNVSPLSKGAEVSQEGSADPVVESAVRGTGVKLLDITALSELRDEGHISRYSIKATDGVNDCLHWCLPGIPDTWNELLFAQL